MLFSSPIFLFAFLPIFFIIYFSLRTQRLRNLWLLIVSLIFYTWGEGKLVMIMLLTSGIDYVAGLGIERGFRGIFRPRAARAFITTHRSRSQTVFLVLSVVSNLALLGFFKYFNFGIDNLNAIFEFFGWQTITLSGMWQIVLPLGISFYTFQSMSYTIDVYRGTVKATTSYIDFMAFVTMFPQLVAGPIVRYEVVARELIDRIVTRNGFAYGIRRFVMGLGKKMLIANLVAVPADAIFALPAEALTAPMTWFGAVCYALQIYFDFSGYSDMAIGMGRMLGFNFLENFNFPYVAKSIRDFWRRWHISLSTWFRDYLYIPLGGNKRSRGRVYFNLLFVFFVTGLWHGSSWNFIVWGLFHGVFLLLERTRFGELLGRVWWPIRQLYVLFVVLIGWVFFRAETLGEAWQFIIAMFRFGTAGQTEYHLGLFVTPVILWAFVAGIIGCTPVIPWLHGHIRRWWEQSAHVSGRIIQVSWTTAVFIALAGIFLLTVMHMANDTYNPFIYFRF
ncbi:MAG: MBOAT family protein [Candidatus Kerfeldbacteria bacterium]|nr:MBOAT family protein [Candidatus Kerfeldbacteria bacterium]